MKWEYKAVKYDGSIPLSEWLNNFGADHWRLIFCNIETDDFIFEKLSPDIPFNDLKKDVIRHNKMVKQEGTDWVEDAIKTIKDALEQGIK